MAHEGVKLSTPHPSLAHLNSLILSHFGSGLILPVISGLLLNSICK
jgi:hypothetical protein